MKEKTLSSLCERTFSPQETLKQIIGCGDFEQFQKWNIFERILTIGNKDNEIVGMFLKFNHKNYTDLVMITLDSTDLYHLRFMNVEREITHEVEGLFFDQLFEVIDNYINSLEPVMMKDLCMN